MHPGEYSPELMSLYHDNRTFSSVFLTTYNPFSNIVTDAENTAAQQANYFVACAGSTSPASGTLPDGPIVRGCSSNATSPLQPV